MPPSLMKRLVIISGAISIVAIVVAVHWLPPRSLATDACVNNLMTIQAVKQDWAAEHHKLSNEVPMDSDLFGPDKYIRERPLCPLGGTYTLGAVSEPARCSIPRHRLTPEMLRAIAQPNSATNRGKSVRPGAN